MTGYKKILIGYPSERGHLKILEDGLRFGKLMGTEIDVIHVAEFLPEAMDYSYYTGPEMLLVDKAQEDLARLRKEFVGQLKEMEETLGTTARLLEADGNAAQSVVDLSPQYGLVIIGSGREGEKIKRLLGSMARNVVRFAESPVLVLREWQSEKSVIGIKRILVPVDGSDVANFAAAHAGLIADKLGAEVTLLHVWERKDKKMLSRLKRDNVDLKEIRNEICERVLNDAENTMVTEKRAQRALEEGEPDAIIMEQSENYDLVVMGTWGRGGIKHFLLGTIAENVAQHAHCPVLLVRGIHE